MTSRTVRRSRLRSRGRPSGTSPRAPNPSRIMTTPTIPAPGMIVVAIAAPPCSPTTPPSTSAGAGTRPSSAEIAGEPGEDGGGGAGTGPTDPFGVGMGSFAFWSVEHGGEAGRGQEGRVRPVRHGGHGRAGAGRADQGLGNGFGRGGL